MESLWKDDHNLSSDTHVRSIIYQDFYHGILHIANEGRVIKI